MLNDVFVKGRFARDLELKKTTAGDSVLSFTLAVSYKDVTNWIDCVAYKDNAESLSRFFKKGDEIIIAGEITTRTFEYKGSRTKVTEVKVRKWEFGARKKDSEVTESTQNPFTEEAEPEKYVPKNSESKTDKTVPEDDLPF